LANIVLSGLSALWRLIGGLDPRLDIHLRSSWQSATSKFAHREGVKHRATARVIAFFGDLLVAQGFHERLKTTLNPCPDWCR